MILITQVARYLYKGTLYAVHADGENQLYIYIFIEVSDI